MMTAKNCKNVVQRNVYDIIKHGTLPNTDIYVRERICLLGICKKKRRCGDLSTTERSITNSISEISLFAVALIIVRTQPHAENK